MNRRRFLGASLGSLAFTAVAGPARLVLAQRCDARTEPNIEGPFFRPGAPARNVLDAQGHLQIRGVVRDPGCRPMGDAVMEVWHADREGEYDNLGFTHRGTLRTDAAGRYRIETIVPGRYLNGSSYRPAHIHVKVHANGRPPLTTQLYFPGDPHNERDPWFRDSLVLRMAPPGCGQITHAGFDFVL